METCKCSKENEIATLISQNISIFKQLEETKAELKEMGKLQKTLYEMATSVTLLASELTQVRDDMSSVKDDMKDVKKLANNMEAFNDVKNDVEELKKQPSKELLHYKRLIAGAIIGAIISFMMGKLL